MKILDLTKLGGFPLTQNALQHMQEAYTEIAKSLVDTATPVIISGLKESTTGTTTTYTEGYVAVAGEVIKVSAGSHHISAVQSAQLKIVTLTTTLIYDNGSSHAAKINKVGEIVQDSTGTFLLFGLKRLHELRAAESRGEWQTVKDNSTGKVQYLHDKLNNMVSVRGWLLHTESNSNVDQSGAQSSGATIPSSLVPAALGESYNLNFKTTIGRLYSVGALPVLKDISGSVYETGTIIINASGHVSLIGRKLAAGTTMPKHYFNFSYYLD